MFFIVPIAADFVMAQTNEDGALLSALGLRGPAFYNVKYGCVLCLHLFDAGRHDQTRQVGKARHC